MKKKLSLAISAVTLLIIAVLVLFILRDNPKNEDTSSPDTFKLLQGTWRSSEGESSYVSFEGNQMKEGSGGSTISSNEFILSDGCRNKSDADRVKTPQKDRYISDTKSDLCWYIVTIDQNNLSLSYLARGNTLNYKRSN